MIQAQFLSSHFHTVEEILLNIKSGTSIKKITEAFADFFNQVDPIDILFITQEHFVNTDDVGMPEVQQLVSLLQTQHANGLYQIDDASFLSASHPIQIFLKENKVFKER